MEAHLIGQMMGMIRDAENFPIHTPLFTATTGFVYDTVVGLLAVFQKGDGSIVVFHLRWDTSHDYLESGYEREWYKDLIHLFRARPQYFIILQPVDTEEKKEVICESRSMTKNKSSWRSCWGLLRTSN